MARAGVTYACPVAVAVGYRGSIAVRDALVGAPAGARTLGLSCWDDSFGVHGIVPLPTPPSPGPVMATQGARITTDAGSEHRSMGIGGHGHPRFLWNARFEPALPAGISELVLSAATEAAPVTATIRLPRWPPVRHEAGARAASAPTGARPPVDRGGPPLPDRVVALGADLGVVADGRRALTLLYCWRSWFLLTVEATPGDDPPAAGRRELVDRAWEMEDDRGNVYAGMDTGGWGGPDVGAHIAFAPGLDPQARELRLSFPDPLGRAGHLTAVVGVPEDAT